MTIFRRLLCGVLVAAAFGGVGWIADQLTVGMILTRHLTVSQLVWGTRIWIAGCLAFGLAVGLLFRREMLTDRVGWVCWGAVMGLTVLTVGSYVMQLLIGPRGFSLPGSGIHFSLDEISLYSAPAALIAGGLFGWYVYRHSATGRRETLEQDHGNRI